MKDSLEQTRKNLHSQGCITISLKKTVPVAMISLNKFCLKAICFAVHQPRKENEKLGHDHDSLWISHSAY